MIVSIVNTFLSLSLSLSLGSSNAQFSSPHSCIQSNLSRIVDSRVNSL